MPRRPPLDVWESAGGVILTDTGRLYGVTRDDDDPQYEYLGTVEDWDAPPELAAAVAGLVDLWRDAFDPAAEARAAYHYAVGG